MAFAALRRHGYRSENRYLVFQALAHTVNFPPAKWRVFDHCHNLRNLAEYEGHFDVDQKLIEALTIVTGDLEIAVEAIREVKESFMNDRTVS